MKTLKITQGNAFKLYIPVVLLSTDGRSLPDMAELSINPPELVPNCGEITPLSYTFGGNNIIVDFDDTGLAIGHYSLSITGEYSGRPIAEYFDNCLDIVKNSSQSNWDGFIFDGVARLDTQLFIAGAYVSDEELERLRSEAQHAIDEANAAKEQANAAKEQANELAAQAVAMSGAGIALQGNDPTATNTAILEAIKQGGGGGGSFPTDYARENTLNLARIDIESIYDDMAREETLHGASVTLDDIREVVRMIAANMYKGVPSVMQSGNVVTIAPNQRNVWSAPLSSLDVTLGGAASGIVNEYIMHFTAGDGFALTLNAGAGVVVKWYGGEVPTWESGAIYEIDGIIDNGILTILFAKFE